MDEPLTEDDKAIYRDAAAYRAIHGDRWSEEAVKRLQALSDEGSNRETFERWVAMINIMSDLSQPKH